MPLILGPDRSKLSKRHGITSVDLYARRDIFPRP
jgi:glutamyl/glutaminyl-tRNA synthetase